MSVTSLKNIHIRVRKVAEMATMLSYMMALAVAVPQILERERFILPCFAAEGVHLHKSTYSILLLFSMCCSKWRI